MPFKDFIDNLTNVEKKLIRSLEHLYKKLIKANFAGGWPPPSPRELEN